MRTILGTLVLVTGCQVVFPFSMEGGANDARGAGEDGEPTTTVKHAFVTSESFTGDLGGLEGADGTCARLAAAAGLPGTFMAWLSTSTASPATRMTRSTGPYRAVGESPLADNWDDLTDGMIQNAIRTDEHGDPVSFSFVCAGFEVWSNTTASGELALDSCNDWTSTSVSGTAGNMAARDARWTYDPDCPTIGCLSGMPFYCVEQ